MKFYVNCGPVKGIIDCDSPREAAKLIIKKFGNGKLLNQFTFVSEKGFENDAGIERKDFIFTTDILMNEIK